MDNYFKELFLFNHKVKKITNTFLKSPLFNQNPFYRYLLNRQIKKIISIYKDRPYCLRIENTNNCNSRCFLCPHSLMKRHKGVMDKRLYIKIIDEAKKFKINYINLHNFGEPLLDKDFVWRIKYAKDKGIEKISTNTNGLLLKSDLSKDLVKSGLDEIYISIDAATKATYNKVRTGLDFQKVKSNIINLSKIKKKNAASKPKIIVDFLESSLNFTETERFINDWEKIADRVCISSVHDWAGKKTLPGSKKTKSYVYQSLTPCRLPFTELVIAWDGQAFLCCLDVEGEEVVGDAKNEHLWDIWNSESLKIIREKQLTMKIDDLKLCRSCQNRVFWWI